MAKINYTDVFDAIFEGSNPENRVQYANVIANPNIANVSLSTRKKHLKSYIDNNPQRLFSLAGMIPSPETVIALVESELNSITEENIVNANAMCAEIIGDITRPMVLDFVTHRLAQNINNQTNNLQITLEDLIAFLLGDFSDYIRASGNGLMSIAGSLNEKLLHRVLENSGMTKGVEFDVTGTDSQADIIIHTAGGNNLGVEVKSYHARERLLRGLQDVQEPKIGVGYFKDAAEFNHTRTITLLQANPAAIYMPSATLINVDAIARSVTVNARIAFGSVLYRPLERFGRDMLQYSQNGTLPEFNGI